jgi:hypothetical protein
MSSEIIQSVAYDNYDDFQHVNFIFSQNSISLFWGLFKEETDLQVNRDVLTSRICNDNSGKVRSDGITRNMRLWFLNHLNFKNDLCFFGYNNIWLIWLHSYIMCIMNFLIAHVNQNLDMF